MPRPLEWLAPVSGPDAGRLYCLRNLVRAPVIVAGPPWLYEPGAKVTGTGQSLPLVAGTGSAAIRAWRGTAR